MKPPTLQSRAAGVLLHPTSLPGPFGSGDLGPEAYHFADTLAAAGQRWWQTLPTNPPGPPPGNSPYSSTSAFAGSPWLISPQLLARDGLLTPDEIAAPTLPPGRVDFPRMMALRLSHLRRAFARFSQRPKRYRASFDTFVADNASWLPDFCLFAALKDALKQSPWNRWPRDLRLRRVAVLRAASRDHAAAIAFHTFVQWLFDRQWSALHTYCNTRGIGLIGDVPIFVGYDSADVWARRELFILDRAGQPTVVSGYPADVFAPKGQKWNHPHYRWRTHHAERFEWWLNRFGKVLRDFDAVRIDHFLGFHRAWAVPAKAPHAKRGRWLATPGDHFFSLLRRRMGDAPIIAEDLGKPTPQALAMRDKFGFPGMRVVQFAFGDEYHLPHTFPPNCVAYSGNQDTDTTAGWLRKVRLSRNGQHERIRHYVGASARPTWDIIRSLYTSAANTVIIPVQDVLELGSDQRMNVPGVEAGNWHWRMTRPLPPAAIQRLRALAGATGRLGNRT